jgi:hypothetical protein
MLLNILLQLKMLSFRQFLWKPLLRKTRNPQTTQHKLLMLILRTNKDTVFGKEHDFSSIKSYTDFKKNVPVQSYEDLRPYIEKQEVERIPYINTDQPIMYAQTSGTTGQPKYIPILKSTIKQYKHSQNIFAYTEFMGIPGVYDGKVLAIVSPAEEGVLETGTSYGSMSGLVYKSMPDFVHTKYIVPQKVFEISDYDLKYYLIVAFAMAENNITLIATANPSTLLRIHSVIQDQWNELIKDIETGNQHGLKANPDRACHLSKLKAKNKLLTFADLWPSLKSVTTWTGGSCSVLIPSVKKLLHPSTKIVEMGYLSSEFRGSITIDVLRNRSIPTIHENFFEFVERDAWENENVDFLTIEKLEIGKQYYVLVTTQNGLYRYSINDIIEVDGRFNNTPSICFVQKGKGVTNLTGEKLHESQVIEAMQKLREDHHLECDFFMMFGCHESLRYSLFIEAKPFADVTRLLEKYIGQLNIEFKAKRASARLKETSILFLKDGTAELYKQHYIDQGQREGQFKLINLQYNKDCTFDFNQHVRG